MSYLDDFLDEERLLVLSVPVRAGFWISQVDDVPGTTRDEEKERRALEKVLKLIFTRTHENALTNDVAEDALKRRDLWPEWEASASTVLADLPKALLLVKNLLPADAYKGYQKAIYYIANVVAQAASEEGGENAKGDHAIAKILDSLSVKTDMTEPENVSKIEKAALQKLLEVLKG